MQLLQLHLLVICGWWYLHPHYCTFYAALGITCHLHICQYTSRMFPHSLIMSRAIVQVQSSSISLGQIFCGVKNQKLMFLSSTVKYFWYPEIVIQGSYGTWKTWKKTPFLKKPWKTWKSTLKKFFFWKSIKNSWQLRDFLSILIFRN